VGELAVRDDVVLTGEEAASSREKEKGGTL